MHLMKIQFCNNTNTMCANRTESRCHLVIKHITAAVDHDVADISHNQGVGNLCTDGCVFTCPKRLANSIILVYEGQCTSKKNVNNFAIELQALTFVPEGNQELEDMFARWSIAYSKVLACHLREDGDVHKTMKVSSLKFMSHICM